MPKFHVSGEGFEGLEIEAFDETAAISEYVNILVSMEEITQEEGEAWEWKARPAGPKCQCEGKGYLLTASGKKLVCPDCGGVGDPDDDDPQCVCGVYRSEHSMMGCREGFQSAGSWAVEKEFIGSLDDDMYERIYHADEYSYYG